MKDKLRKLREVAQEIQSLVTSCVAEWRDLTEEVITHRPTPDSWSAKEIIGHLIDSASNNHQRFVRLQIRDSLIFPDYQHDNEYWVKIQRYQERPWQELLALWRHFNSHVDYLIQSVNPHCLSHAWQVDSETRISLRELMSDYLRHMRVHVAQVNECLQSKTYRSRRHRG